jgi:hypothetical protein
MSPSMVCPKCSAQIPEESRFCLACGQPVSSLSQAPTAAAESPAAQMAIAPAPVGRLISSDSLPVGGFTPGMVLTDRYRIIGLIGRGGMGEVYRADDLKLGQPVALKFLPKALADDPVRRERLFAEVRIARQVSHPNICRVYDIGEIDGRHFLTMEYIDGEDLASLLKRIGNLHGTKALDVARQLCAGLAAAHDKGVLHRDLKPANVMIDGRGRVRVTDFGLAVAAGEEVSTEDVSGTPPYMAPEQFAGKGASVRSDIYALGLIFYELFTGRRAFEEKTLAELRAKKETTSPTAPSEIARDIDPIIERVILRCIDKDPRQRPASAVQVAAALPGGDPLAVAIAAGETPSPEMVAAAGTNEGLKPWVAWACLSFIILAIAATVVLKRQYSLLERVPIENPPEVLAAKAREILKSAGYPDPPQDRAFGYRPNSEYFENVQRNDRSSYRFNKLPALAVQFWYRQSPQPIVPPGASSLTPANPALMVRGESLILLDSQGNLTDFRVIPPESPKAADAVTAPDWSALFKASGIDQANCKSVAPDANYLEYDDIRAAWTGSMPDLGDIPVRIEAAARGGKPILWQLIVFPKKSASITPRSSSSVSEVFSFSLLILGATFFARRSLRMGRGDRRGAARLAFFYLAVCFLGFIFKSHSMLNSSEIGSFLVNVVSLCLFWGGLTWLMYIALEPFVRRRWPSVLVGWNRVLAGNFRDPLVGRDLLVGCALGAAFSLLRYLVAYSASLFNAPQPVPSTGAPFVNSPDSLYIVLGIREIFVAIIWSVGTAVVVSLLLGSMLFWARVLLRKTWAAIAFVLLLFAIGSLLPGSEHPVAEFIGTSILIFSFFRFGLLTSAGAWLFCAWLSLFPITIQPVWYSGIGYTGLAILFAFSFYAFHTSLGGQPMFGRASLED